MKQPITVIPPGAQPMRAFGVSHHRASFHGRNMTGERSSAGHLPTLTGNRELSGRRVA